LVLRSVLYVQSLTNKFMGDIAAHKSNKSYT
jgi:hypothetical protein